MCVVAVVIYGRRGAILEYVPRAAAAGTVTAFVSHGLKREGLNCGINYIVRMDNKAN